MFKQIKAVIFDLDGTLVDSMGLWKEIDIEYLGRFGIACPEDIQNGIEGMSFSETAVYFKERFSIPDSLEKIKEDWNEMMRRKYREEIPMKHGALLLLEQCRKHHFRMGIATSNSRELVEEIAAAHGFENYFDVIVTACEVAKGKPAPDVYLEAARQLDVKPSECIVFEDITAGILAGKNAGMRVCAVEDDYSLADRKEKETLADYYIKDYTEIFHLFEQMEPDSRKEA